MKVKNRIKIHCLALAGVALFSGPASAGLWIDEPFDYAHTEGINNGAYLGDGNQAGGLGLGTWSLVDAPENVLPVHERQD